MADMTTIKGKIKDTIYPNGTGAITAEKHQSLLLDVVDNINEAKQDTLASGQNIRSLVSGTSLLGSGILHELGTAFIYEYESEQVFAMMNGTREEVKPWMLNRATASQVAQSISILRQGVLQAIVPVVIKTRAEEYAIICWEYDGLIYEIAWEDDAYKVVTKPKGDEFDKQGTYPSMHVGTADDLAGRGESVPAEFGFRASGGKSIKDGRAYIKRIKGNSVVWNQLGNVANKLFTTTKANITLELTQGSNIIKLSGIYDGTTGDLNFYITTNFPSIAGVVGHKYLCTIRGNKNIEMSVFGAVNPAIIVTSSSIVTCSTEGTIDLAPRIMDSLAEGTEINEEVSFYCTDLTQMFGAGNEPTTIEEFYARVATLGVDMYAYNEGQVIHCNTESIKSVGDNAWDEEWDFNYINYSTGQPTIGHTGGRICSANFIRVIPFAPYYFLLGGNMSYYVHKYDSDYNWLGEPLIVDSGNTITFDANVAYIKFASSDKYGEGTTYNHDIMISLVHSGWKQDTDAGYQPYWQDILPLPIIRNYFPDGMKSAGSAHDEIRFNKASGKWEYSKSKTGGGRIKGVDMGTLNWNYTSGNISKFSCVMPSDARVFQENVLPNMMTSLYTAQKNNASILRDKNIYCAGSYLGVLDSSYTDAATFKAAMAGVILYYEAAEWEWVELDAEDQNFRDYYNVADFGTEEAIPATDAEGNIIPSAPFSADIIYQFNAVDMIREHEIEITELQNVIATMQAQLTALTNGGQ